MTEKLKDQKTADVFVKEEDYDLSQPHIMKLGDWRKQQEIIQDEVDKANNYADGLFKGLQAVNKANAERMKNERKKKNQKITKKLNK